MTTMTVNGIDGKTPITITTTLGQLMPLTSDHGGYRGQECSICGASDWQDKIKHEPNCQVEKFIKEFLEKT